MVTVQLKITELRFTSTKLRIQLISNSNPTQ